jgi:hypothetical protein
MGTDGVRGAAGEPRWHAYTTDVRLRGPTDGPGRHEAVLLAFCLLAVLALVALAAAAGLDPALVLRRLLPR